MSLWGGVDYDDDVPDVLDNSMGSLQLDFNIDQAVETAKTDPDAARQQLQKALIEAAQNGRDDIIHEILGNADTSALVDIDFQDESSTTALGYASCFGHENAVAELLRFNASPNLQDKNEWTPLMWAVNNNHLGIVKQLLAADADTGITTSSGRTAFDLPMAEDSVTYMYLSANGYLKSTSDAKGDSGFYEEAIDPAEVDAQFNNSLKESAAALGGFGAYHAMDDLADDDYGEDEAVLDAPVKSSYEALPDFDWKQYKHSDSYVLPKQLVPEFLDIVITNFQPTLQKNQYPASANALFMACRYFYYEGNTESFTAFCNPLGRRIELAVQDEKRSGDLAYLSYWLANAEVFLYYLRKDEGINEATISSLQPVFERLVQVISDAIQTATHRLLTPLMAPCILDFNSIPEYGKVEYRDEWKLFRTSSKKKGEDEDDREEVAQKHMLPPSYDVLMKNPGPQRVTSILSSLLLLFQIYSVHSVTQLQIIAKLVYFMNSHMFNRIVRSRRYLNRRRAMQIRLNISNIEDWCRNNYFRPQSLIINGKEAIQYKSLVDVGRTFLAPLVQILAWLQTFSGFGTDFTNVVSTLQELKAVTPKQLLKTATNYRFETREAPLSKEYKHYLQDLVAHYDRVKDGSTEQDKGPQTGSKDLLDFTDSQTVFSGKSCIELSFELPLPQEVYLDVDLVLPERIPNFQECEQFWGNEDTSALYETQGSRFLVPHVSVDIREQVAKLIEDQDIEATEKLHTRENQEDVVEPEDAISRPEGYDDDGWGGPIW